MHGFREAVCSGGCVSRKEGTIGLLNGVSAARRVSHLTSRRRQISLRIHGRARRPESLFESQVLRYHRWRHGNNRR